MSEHLSSFARVTEEAHKILLDFKASNSAKQSTQKRAHIQEETDESDVDKSDLKGKTYDNTNKKKDMEMKKTKTTFGTSMRLISQQDLEEQRQREERTKKLRQLNLE